jgi:hypothetical protein
VPQDDGGVPQDKKASRQMTAALRHLRNPAVISRRRSVISDAAPSDDGGAPQDKKLCRQMTAALRHLRNPAVISRRRSVTSDAAPSDDGGIPRDKKALRHLRNPAAISRRRAVISDAAPTDEIRLRHPAAPLREPIWGSFSRCGKGSGPAVPEDVGDSAPQILVPGHDEEGVRQPVEVFHHEGTDSLLP